MTVSTHNTVLERTSESNQKASHAAKEPHVPGAGVMHPEPKNVDTKSAGYLITDENRGALSLKSLSMR